MNRAIRIHRTGGPECLQWDDVPMPTPERGEVVLAHRAVGVNFLDLYQRSGLYALPGLPSGLGNEAVGIVEQLGPGVQGVHVGDRVGYAGGVPAGAYCERRAVPAWRLVPIPAGIEDTTAAAVLLKGLTAEYLVRRTFKVGPGHRVLVHAAAGGTGLLLCQWLRHLGATVFGTVSTEAKAELASANGCHHAIVTSRESFVAVVRTITKDKGVDVVYDSVGKDTLDGSLQCLKRRGLLVSFGNASGAPRAVVLAELMQAGSVFVTRPTLLDYTSTRQELLRAAHVLFGLVEGGVLRVRIDCTLPLAQAAAAHRRLEARQSAGAIVLLP
ncbi:MAG TPA: quinone oxidoreductase [Planctomycetota bacterium]|nr:quinone oxidoreductase [Planctomycetota bacterium]